MSDHNTLMGMGRIRARLWVTTVVSLLAFLVSVGAAVTAGVAAPSPSFPSLSNWLSPVRARSPCRGRAPAGPSAWLRGRPRGRRRPRHLCAVPQARQLHTVDLRDRALDQRGAPGLAGERFGDRLPAVWKQFARLRASVPAVTDAARSSPPTTANLSFHFAPELAPSPGVGTSPEYARGEADRELRQRQEQTTEQ